MRVQRASTPTLYLLAALCATAGVYWIGLHGPFLLDDVPNFAVIRDWLAGERTLAEVVFNNTSLLTHRALAMASFVASAAIHGYDPFGFKLDNLILHLLCGVLLYLLMQRLLSRDSQLAGHARWGALFVTTIWLLHPFHASTVLYAVQRMAQWASLFCILGLLLYLHVRTRLESGNTRLSIPSLFLLFPALLFAGYQGKQNAAALPLLCLVVELGYFQADPRKWPRQIGFFFLLFLLLPALAVLACLQFRPELLLAGYAEYEFTPGQRLLSESRVLFAYIGQILAPHTPSMGVFTDSYQPSTGLLSPATTLFSILGLVSISAVAIVLRPKFPAVFTGWFLFLAAHSVEGSFLPLELYYEHRNYLPMAGLLLACTSLLALGANILSHRGIRIGRVSVACAVLLVAALSVMTHGRARVWSNALVMVGAELRNNPESYRVVAYNVGAAATVGDYEYAYGVLDRTMALTQNDRLRAQAMLLRAWLDCTHRNGADPTQFEEAMALLPAHVDLNTFFVIDQVAQAVENDHCNTPDLQTIADSLSNLLDRSKGQPDDFNLKWAMRNRTAFLYADAGRWEDARKQALLGWQPTTPAEGAARLVEISLVTGHLEEAERILAEASARAQSNSVALLELDIAQQLVEAERRTPGFNRLRVARQQENPH